LLECIEVIKEFCEREVTVMFEKERYGDLRYFVCDINKARQALKWEPKIRPRKGVEKLIQWIEANRNLFASG
jgi:CDP-paratose 2-epimerase